MLQIGTRAFAQARFAGMIPSGSQTWLAAASWEISKVNVFCSLLCLIIWVWNNDISIYDAYI